MIHVIATVEIVSGQRDEFLGEFSKVIPLVREETGCIEYGPAIDLVTNIAVQPQPRDNVVIVVEKWQSLPDLEAHLVASHMVQYRKRVAHLVKQATVHVLKPVVADD